MQSFKKITEANTRVYLSDVTTAIILGTLGSREHDLQIYSIVYLYSSVVDILLKTCVRTGGQQHALTLTCKRPRIIGQIQYGGARKECFCKVICHKTTF